MGKNMKTIVLFFAGTLLVGCQSATGTVAQQCDKLPVVTSHIQDGNWTKDKPSFFIIVDTVVVCDGDTAMVILDVENRKAVKTYNESLK